MKFLCPKCSYQLSYHSKNKYICSNFFCNLWFENPQKLKYTRIQPNDLFILHTKDYDGNTKVLGYMYNNTKLQIDVNKWALFSQNKEHVLMIGMGDRYYRLSRDQQHMDYCKDILEKKDKKETI